MGNDDDAEIADEELLSPDLYEEGEPEKEKKGKAPAGKKGKAGAKTRKGAESSSKKSATCSKEGGLSDKENEAPEESHDSGKQDASRKSAKMMKRKAPAKKSVGNKRKRGSQPAAEKQRAASKQSKAPNKKMGAAKEELGTDATQPDSENSDREAGKPRITSCEFLSCSSGDTDVGDLLTQAVQLLGVFKICGGAGIKSSPDVFVSGSKRSRTGSLLSAIARGIWVVSHDWILASISAGEWKPFVDYEIGEAYPGAKLSRLAREQGENRLLEKCRIGVVGRSKMPSHELQQLISHCGGEVSREGSCDFVLVCSGAKEPDIKPLENAKSRRVTEKWLYDSISRWKVQPKCTAVELKLSMAGK